MKSIEIKLPKTLDDFSVAQAAATLEFFSTQPFSEKTDVNTMLRLIEVVSGQPFDLLRRVDIKAIQESFFHINKCLTRKRKTPPKSVKLNGQDYYFEQDFGHKSWTGGRYIDCDNKATELHENPQYMIAICYIEKGSQYHEFPLEERAEVMRNHFRGSDFIDLQAFFLGKLKELSPGYEVLQIARSQILKDKALKIMRESG